MKLDIDGFSKQFTVPIGSTFGSIWKTLLNYLTDHNRTIVGARIRRDLESEVQFINQKAISENENTSTTDLHQLEISTIPTKFSFEHFSEKTQTLEKYIDNEIFMPLTKMLQDESSNKTDKIKNSILTNAEEKISVFDELVSSFFFLSQTSDGEFLKPDVDAIESLNSRIQNAIKHNDMSTLIHLISVEMKNQLNNINNLLAPIKNQNKN